MAADVDIANAALRKIGSPLRLQFLLGSNDPKARSLNDAYLPTLKAELRRYVWSFAKTRASIAADAAQSVWGNWNRYAVPGDFMYLIRDDESGQDVDWELEGGNTAGTGTFILSATASPLAIKYVRLETNVALMDPLFQDALAARLGYDNCKALGGTNETRDRVKAEYRDAISEAMRLGACEKQSVPPPEDTWINVRIA